MIPNLLLFGRLLSRLGIPVQPSMSMDAARALAIIDLGRKEDFYYALRANLISNREAIPIFDQAFAIFWAGDRIDPSSHDMSSNNGTEFHWSEAKEGTQATDTLCYSPEEVLSQKDFGHWADADTREMRKVLAHVLAPLSTRASRRHRWGRRGPQLDLGKTLRTSMKHRGELLHLFKRRRKIKKRKIIFLCDVSGSMDMYTRFILLFMYGLKQVDRGAEGFVFSTRLTRITRLLERNTFRESIQLVSTGVCDWSGGTRIGECLKEFNQRYAPRILRADSIFLIYSDGWDRGDPGLLRRELQTIRRKAAQVVWLNPLMGHPAYQPICQGMKVALPCLDCLLPAHNVASLREVARVLSRS